ncbi:MAG: hypothetical protein ACP6IQ_08870 [Candidatus Njordarchaeia archaeon]
MFQLLKLFIYMIILPWKGLKELDEYLDKSLSTMAKLMLGFMLTFLSSSVAFFGIIVIGLWRASPVIDFLISAISAAILIPVVWWIFDTLLISIAISIFRERVDIIRLLNIRAFSMIPIPISAMYKYFIFGDVSLLRMLNIDLLNPITVILLIWEVFLLSLALFRMMRINLSKSILMALIPIAVKILISVFL